MAKHLNVRLSHLEALDRFERIAHPLRTLPAPTSYHKMKDRKSDTIQCICKTIPANTLSTFTAAEYGDLATLKYRLKKSNDRRSCFIDKDGYSLTHYAAQHNRVAVVRYTMGICFDDDIEKLLWYSAKENRGCGCTPLHRAAFSGAIGAIKIILDLSFKDENVEMIRDRTTIVRIHNLLLAPDESIGDKMTALHKAVAGGRFMVVQLLIDSCTKLQYNESNLLEKILTAKDSNGRSPYELSILLLEEDPQNVSRWDSIAESTADWQKCSLLLKEAYRKLEFNLTNKHASKSIPTPDHLFDLKTCLDCESEGMSCKTRIWEVAFRSYICQTIDTSISNTNTNKESPSIDELSSIEEPQLKHETVEQPKASSTPHEENITFSGRLCSRCKQKTFILKKNLDGSLICQSCHKIKNKR